MAALNLLIIGDITGKPGMRAVRSSLPTLVAQHNIDFIIVNGENAAGGFGLTPDLAQNLFDWGIDCITTGNHVWRQRDLISYIDREPRLLRPLNLSKNQPGAGIGVYHTPGGVAVGVMNLVGRIYMDPADNPFVAADAGLAQLKGTSIIMVDFHAEATSEKRAMGFHLDGRVSAVIGTHTHVPTADEQILTNGTAYITDIGMTGPHDSVIGVRKELILDKFITGMPHAFKLANRGIRLQAVRIRVDVDSGHAVGIERVDLPVA